MKFTRIAALVLLLSLVALPCMAGVSPEEAAQLKTTLTPFGGERAGNKEGTIPEWTAKYPEPLAGTPADQLTGDLFPNEKPLFSITAKNMDQYADKLTEGLKIWMKRHPENYRLDVYPTHRTGVFPEYAYEATFKNATHGKLSPDGMAVLGAIGGIPFPIPKSGLEMIWDHILLYEGSYSRGGNRSFIVPPGGKRLLAGEGVSDTEFPWNYKGMTEERYRKEYEGKYILSFYFFSGPPQVVGQSIIDNETSDYDQWNEPVIYEYLVGQRRVRRAPTLRYDAPNPMNSGYGTSDENTMFWGKPDKYDWKIIGKKEMYFPYNCNKMYRTKDEDLFSGHNPNPDKVRWELHRVWVLDASLKPGKRHVCPHRVIYLDEDTWDALGTDYYDGQGKMWKIGLMYPMFEPRVPMVYTPTETFFNMQTDGWVVDDFPSPELHPQDILGGGNSVRPISYFSPDAMAARGLR